MSGDNSSRPLRSPDNEQPSTSSASILSTGTGESALPLAQALPEPSAQGVTLRSGTVLQGVQLRPVSFENYFSNLYETARESDRLAALYSDVLENRNTQAPEQRLAQLEHFREEADRFKAELQNFDGFSRSLILDSKVNKEEISTNYASDRISDSVSAENLNASDLVLNYPDTSLQEDSQSDNPQEGLNFQSRLNRNQKCGKMVDYTKVVKLTSQMVPLFSGTPHPHLSQELQTFVGCCRQVMSCLPEEEHNAFLRIFPTRLRGEAYQLFASSVPNTFKEVEERLNRTYLPRETYQELVNRLITLRQNPLETLTAFTTRLKQLLTLCNEAAETKYGATAAPAVKTQLDDFAKNALKSGVNNPHLCQYLLTLSEASLDALVTKALDMERLQQGSLYFQPAALPVTQSISPNIANIPPYTSGTVDLSASQNPTMPSVQNLQPNYFQEIQRSQPHHTATPSPRHTAPQDRPVRNFARPNQGTPKVAFLPNSAASRVTCSFCSNRGHTYDECLKRKNTPYCLSCKRNGHDIRDCGNNRPAFNTGQPRSPPSRPPQDRNNSTGPRVYTVRLKCNFCGRKGHTTQQCHQKLRWEKQSQGNDSQSTQKSPARL